MMINLKIRIWTSVKLKTRILKTVILDAYVCSRIIFGICLNVHAFNIGWTAFYLSCSIDKSYKMSLYLRSTRTKILKDVH